MLIKYYYCTETIVEQALKHYVIFTNQNAIPAGSACIELDLQSGLLAHYNTWYRAEHMSVVALFLQFQGV